MNGAWGVFRVRWAGVFLLIMIIIYPLVALPAAYAGSGSDIIVEVFEYVKEPSYVYHNLIVYEIDRYDQTISDGMVDLAFSVGERIMPEIASGEEIDELHPRLRDILLKTIDSEFRRLVDLLERLGVKPSRPLWMYTRSTLLIRLFNSTYDRNMNILRMHADEIGRLYAEILEAGYRAINMTVTIHKVAIVTIRLPIDSKEYLTAGWIEDVGEELHKLYGGWPKPRWLAVVGGWGPLEIPHIAVAKSRLREEGVTLREALDQIRWAVRKVTGRDAMLIVYVVAEEPNYKPFDMPQTINPSIYVYLGLVALAFTAVILLAGILTSSLKERQQ